MAELPWMDTVHYGVSCHLVALGAADDNTDLPRYTAVLWSGACTAKPAAIRPSVLLSSSRFLLNASTQKGKR